jgi:hypothetical protein
MKNNHLKVEAFIKQAITACSYDAALVETRNYLQNALISLSKTANKRAKNQKTQKANEEAIQAAKTAQQQWWEMLMKNAAKFKIDIKE